MGRGLRLEDVSRWARKYLHVFEQTCVVYLIVRPSSVGRGLRNLRPSTKTRRCISRQEDGF